MLQIEIGLRMVDNDTAVLLNSSISFTPTEVRSVDRLEGGNTLEPIRALDLLKKKATRHMHKILCFTPRNHSQRISS